jgi:hypothetical protein
LQELRRGLELALAESAKLFRRATRDQPFDHLAGAHAVDIGDDAAQPDAGIVQELVQAVLFPRQARRQFAPVARDHTKLAQVLGRNEAAAQQPEPRQLRQPFRILHVGLAAGDIPDMEGIDHQGRNSGRFKMREHALPINAGALHHHLLDAMFLQPANQCTHVTLEAAKFAGLLHDRAVRLLNQDRHSVLHPVHVDPGNPFVDCFHDGSPSVKLRVGGIGVSGQKCLVARAIRPIYRASCKASLRNNLGCGLSGWVQLKLGVCQTRERPLTRASRPTLP